MKKLMKVIIIASKRKYCGIAEYSRTLYQSLLKADLSTNGSIRFSICAFTIGPFINFPSVAFNMFMPRHDILHFQFHSGLFGGNIPVLGCWISRVNFIVFYCLFILRSLLLRYGRGIERPMFKRRLPKVLITLHDICVPINPILKNLLVKFDCIILHGGVMREVLLKSGIPSTKIREIPHGIPRLREKSRKRDIEQKKIILFGYIHKNKGHHVAIEALRYLPRHYELLICGKPRLRKHNWYFRQIKEKAAEIGVKERVKFLGFIPNERLEEVFAQGDCCIFPYLWSDHLLEYSGALGFAIASGLPVITSDTPIFREVRDRYNYVILCKRDDPHDLANAIRDVMENEKLRKILTYNARIFQKTASWERVAELTLNTYLEFIVGHPDSIYEDESQRQRIKWLRDRSQGSILEVGCAIGYVAACVGATAGVDINFERLLLAKRKYTQIQFLLANATKLPFLDDSYDTVLLPEILEHLRFEEAKKALQEAARVSRQFVLITSPRSEHPDYIQNATIGRRNPEHLWDPSEKKMRSLLDGYSYRLQASPDGKFWFVEVRKQK